MWRSCELPLSHRESGGRKKASKRREARLVACVFNINGRSEAIKDNSTVSDYRERAYKAHGGCLVVAQKPGLGSSHVFQIGLAGVAGGTLLVIKP